MSDGAWVLLGTALGSVLGAGGSLLHQWLASATARHVRGEERANRHNEVDRERFEEVYRAAITRLTVCHDALHRAVRMLYCRDHAGGWEPYTVSGSVDWAVTEADAMRGAQPLLELFGSPLSAAEYGKALLVASSLREAMTGSDGDWDHEWARRKVTEFDQHRDAAVEQMRRDLQSLRRAPHHEQPTEQL